MSNVKEIRIISHEDGRFEVSASSTWSAGSLGGVCLPSFHPLVWARNCWCFDLPAAASATILIVQVSKSGLYTADTGAVLTVQGLDDPRQNHPLL